MSKAIVMSTQPNWVAKILNGEKKVEVRKTKPNCKLPIDVYLYCTKDKKLQWVNGCLPIAWGQGERNERLLDKTMNGKVVAKFTLNKVEGITLKQTDTFGYDEDKPKDYETETMGLDDLLKNSCLGYEELHTYLDSEEVGYAWHIDNLVIFDKPKELWEFYKSRFEPNKITDAYEKTFNDLSKYRVTKAPQSWQYVYVKGE